MNFGIGTIKLNGINTYNNIGGTTSSFNNIVKETDYGDIEEIDYSQDESIELEKKQENELLDFFKDKGINTTFWAATKDTFKEWANAYTGSNVCSTLAGMLTIALLEGGYKTILDGIYNGELDSGSAAVFASGFTKSIYSNVIKEGIKLTDLNKFMDLKGFKEWQSVCQDELKIGPEGLEKLLGKTGLKGIKQKNPELFKTIGVGNFTSTAGSIGIGFGIEYIASMSANIVKAAAEGKEINLETTKAGTTLLKSSTKIIVGVAGSLIGGFFGGEAGAKTGKLVGTVIGATIGEVQVEAFDNDEGWCALAGGAQIVGAVAGAAIVAFCASNPVGWVMAVGVLAGAAIGFFITWGAYLIEKSSLEAESTGATVSTEFSSGMV